MKFNHINIVAVLCILFSCISAQIWHQLGSYEYYIEDSTRAVSSYSDAESRCSNLQATLAVVKTKQVNDFLVGRIGTVTVNTVFPFAFYIGLKRLSSSRYDFQWIDGTHLTSGFSNWDTGEPNGHISTGEDCVIMGWVYMFIAALPWYDIRCTPGFNLRYICQRLVGTTTNLQTTTEIMTSTYAPETTSTNIEATQRITTSQERSEVITSQPIVASQHQLSNLGGTGGELSGVHIGIIGIVAGLILNVGVIGIVLYRKRSKRRNITSPPTINMELPQRAEVPQADMQNNDTEYLEPIRTNQQDHAYVSIDEQSKATYVNVQARNDDHAYEL